MCLSLEAATLATVLSTIGHGYLRPQDLGSKEEMVRGASRCEAGKPPIAMTNPHNFASIALLRASLGETVVRPMQRHLQCLCTLWVLALDCWTRVLSNTGVVLMRATSDQAGCPGTAEESEILSCREGCRVPPRLHRMPVTRT